MKVYRQTISLVFGILLGISAFGQCPQVVRFQIDACGSTSFETESEFFQFVTKSVFDLNTNSISINSTNPSTGNVVSMSGFVRVAKSVIDALNVKLVSCPTGPVFFDPYAPPYLGKIPAGSMVLAYIDKNPNVVAASAFYSKMCGKAPIFVIQGSGHNLTPIFLNSLNNSECNTSCRRTINVSLGPCSFSYDYDGHFLPQEEGAFVIVSPSNSLEYNPSDGCYPESLPCARPSISLPPSPMACKSIGYELPDFSDGTTGNAKYFTKSGRLGDSFNIYSVVSTSMVLYANDYPNCNPANFIERQFTITIKDGPQLANMQPVNSCGYFVLNSIQGNLVTSNARYYTKPKGGVGSIIYNAGDTIRTSQRLYAYDKDLTTGCDDQAILDIAINTNAPNITNARDTSLSCGATFTFPAIVATNNPVSKNYYTSSNKGSAPIAVGATISNGGTYYAYAESGAGCFDEDTFTVNIYPKPFIQKDSFKSQAFCNYFKFSKYQNATYNTELDESGTPYVGGDSINITQKLFVFVGGPSCRTIDSFTLTQSNLVFNQLVLDQPCKPVFDSLPQIMGTNLTGREAYYSAPGGKGKKFQAGDSVHAFRLPSGLYDSRILYIYDTIVYATGVCQRESQVTIPFYSAVELDNLKDTSIRCDQKYLVPSIKPAVFLSAAVYSAPNKGGNKYVPGVQLTTPGKYYVYGDFAGCHDEDTFNLAIDGGPLFANNLDRIACGADTLPVISGSRFNADSTFYFTQPFGMGTAYKPGNIIVQGNTFYIYDKSQKCIAQDTVQVTINAQPRFSGLPGTGKCDSLKLPSDSLAADLRYFSLPNAKGTPYQVGDLIKSSIKLYKYSGTAICHAEQVFDVVVNKSPPISTLTDTVVCDAFILPIIVGSSLSGGQGFYSESQGKGDFHKNGDTILQSQTFYAFDINGLGCFSEKKFTVTIIPSPKLPTPLPLTGCDSIQLPGDNAFPDLRYYSQSNAQGSSLSPGIWVKNNTKLYQYTGNDKCYDEKSVDITITKGPKVNGLPDTMVCDEFVLPTITGSNLTSNPHYHEVSGGLTGSDRFAGNLITQTMRLWVWAGDGTQCPDEKPFTVTVIPKPAIDSILPLSACGAVVLPPITGSKLSSAAYFDQANGLGIGFNEGDIISQSTTLYAYQAAKNCPAQKTLSITVVDSITSLFTLSDSILCIDQPLTLNHTGKKSASMVYNWSIDGSRSLTLNATPNQTIQLDTGNYEITLRTRGTGCEGEAVVKSVAVIPKLDTLKNLICNVEPDRLVFEWDPTPGTNDYQVDLLQGPFGVRSPQQMIFSNLSLGARVGIRVTPLAKIPCANGSPLSLTCATRQCDPITIEIVNPSANKPYCSGDGPQGLTVYSVGLNPADTGKITRIWNGPGIVNSVFYPSIAGPGNHLITYILTKDSCVYQDTAIFRVGSGSAVILNTKAVECAPPSQRQFSISFQVMTDAKPYSVYYSFAGNRSSVYPFVSADNFTLTASFGLIGDSIRIDSVVDANGCRMLLTSMANTFTFRAIQYISAIDTTSICDYATKTYQYKIRFKNPNSNDPLVILSGGGQIQDSFYISPPVAFNTSHQAVVSHRNGCDTLSFDIMIPCTCTPYRDTFIATTCAADTLVIRGKKYFKSNPTGVDTIPSIIPGLCDTIRQVKITFIDEVMVSIQLPICPDDVFVVGNTIFDKNNLTGTVRLKTTTGFKCDSIINVQLQLVATITKTLRDTICIGDSVIIDGLIFNANHRKDTIVFMNQSANGCDSIVYYDVFVEDLKADVVQNVIGCSAVKDKNLVIRSVTGGTRPYSYAFSTDPTSRVIPSFPFTLNNLPADTFQLIIKSASACTVTVPVAFNPNSTGISINLGPDRVIRLGDTVQVNFNSTATITSFRWITANYLSCFDCPNPIAQPQVSTTYILEVSDKNGCTARDTLRLIVNPDVEVFVPNVFSPLSANETNRELRIYPSPQVFGISRFTIFDRWGNVYVDLKNPPLSNYILAWDGKFKGKDAPIGVYSYKLVYTTVDNKSHTKYGNITLIR